MKLKAILLAVLLALVLTTAAGAMSSTNYRLDWLIPLTSGGGGDAYSAHYAAQVSLGQTVIGVSNSTNYAAQLGFWQVFLRYLKLPLLLK